MCSPLGMISIPTQPLYEAPGQFRHEKLELKSAHRKGTAQGTISFSVTFFELARSLIQRKGEKTESTVEESTEQEEEQPKTPKVKEKAKPTFVTRSEPAESASSLYARRMREMLDARLPASEAQPTGILAFQIHQLSGLAFKDVSNAKSMSSGTKEKNSPSSYVSVFLCDEKVFQTRTKPFSGGQPSWCSLLVLALTMAQSRTSMHQARLSVAIGRLLALTLWSCKREIEVCLPS